MTFFQRLIDSFSDILALAGRLAIFILIAAMLFEVVARYVFGAPTLWAFDISYMLNGSIFLLGSAFTLRQDAHVRIDFLSQRLPLRVQQLLSGLLYLLLMTPITFAFAWAASIKAWKAYVSGEIESVSPWMPVVWPFYAVIAIGLLVFALQFLVEALHYLRGDKSPGSAEAEFREREV